MRSLQARVTDLESQLADLEAARQGDQLRIAGLERELSEERFRREEAERSRAASEQALSTAADELEQADRALASGSGDVSGALAQARALAADAAWHAGVSGSGQGRTLAAEAQRWLDVSQEALRRGDLFQARQAVVAATAAARQAQALAASGRGAESTAAEPSGG